MDCGEEPEVMFEKELSGVLDRSEHNYSINSYEHIAIEMVFNALGYNCEATAENYVRLRKTANILAELYRRKYNR